MCSLVSAASDLVECLQQQPGFSLYCLYSLRQCWRGGSMTKDLRPGGWLHMAVSRVVNARHVLTQEGCVPPTSGVSFPDLYTTSQQHLSPGLRPS